MIFKTNIIDIDNQYSTIGTIPSVAGASVTGALVAGAFVAGASVSTISGASVAGAYLASTSIKINRYHYIIY